jgi:hypothetical protein
VERALTGDHIGYDDLTAAEQQEVVRSLIARGASIRDIAAQLATSKRTVSRRRIPRRGIATQQRTPGPSASAGGPRQFAGVRLSAGGRHRTAVNHLGTGRWWSKWS